jgi:predicted deacetylase
MSKYLLRFDDITPCMNWEIWDEIELFLDSQDIKPIVAIVPDCKDLNIMPSPYNDLFWKRVSVWQSKGWCIAMHGYNHVLIKNKSINKSIVNISNVSEFTGLSYSLQTDKIKRGLNIFYSNGISTDTWVSPAHSFDGTTLKVIHDSAFSTISDGLFVSPCQDKNGILWIPQQLWKFRSMPFGIWTVCYHHNNWSYLDLIKFKKDVVKFRSKITTVDEIKKEFHCRVCNLATKVQSFLFHYILALKKKFRHGK